MSSNKKKENESKEKSEEEDILEEEFLPRSAKLAFGGSTLASGLLSGIVFGPITFFYNVKLGLPEAWVSLAWIIFIGWNMFNDPIFGYIEDNTKSEKYGRRIPYLRFGAPIYGLSFILCWFPIVSISSDVALFWNFLIVLFIFDTMFTITGLINYSLPAEMAISSKTRSNLMVFGGLFSGLAIFLSFVIPVLLLTGDESQQLNPLFQPTMVVIGIVCGLILFVSSFYIRENKYTQMEDTLGFIEGIQETLKNKAFLNFEISNFSFLLAQTILTTAVFYYIQYVLKLSGILALVPIILFFLMVFMFLPVYNKLVEIYSLKKTYIFGLLFTGVSFILFFFLGWVFASAIFGMILLGISFSGYFLMGQMVIADVIDYDEVLTGKRRETTYSGVNALITKPAVSIAPWIFLTLINAFGFDATTNIQTEQAQLGIMLAFTIIPAIFIIGSAIAITQFPLSGAEWQKQKERLGKIHREKERKYLKHLKEKGKL